MLTIEAYLFEPLHLYVIQFMIQSTFIIRTRVIEISIWNNLNFIALPKCLIIREVFRIIANEMRNFWSIRGNREKIDCKLFILMRHTPYKYRLHVQRYSA